MSNSTKSTNITSDDRSEWPSSNACLFKAPYQCSIENDFKQRILSAKPTENIEARLCTTEYFNICWEKAEPAKNSVFGFSEFVTALALLVVIYTVTDIRYRFRVLTAPLPLFRITQIATSFIALGTLFTDIWFGNGWLIPEFLSNQLIWQGILALTFLAVITIWLHYAFIKPPIFSKRNYKKYTHEIYRAIVKGSDTELPIIADELKRSAESIVAFAAKSTVKRKNKPETEKVETQVPDVVGYAHDLLLLIGNRKFCRHIISSTPTTAIVFFDAMKVHKKRYFPIGQFAQNITAEALKNKDSLLYHEDEGYWSGLIGYIKPFSQAIYSNYDLVETLARDHASPLNVHYNLIWSLDAEQLEAYCRAALIFAESYSKNGVQFHSYAMHQILESVKNACRGIYKLREISDWYESDIYKRLRVTMSFIIDLVDLLGKNPDAVELNLRKHEDDHRGNIFDAIADTIFEIMLDAASVKENMDKAWSIQHNIVWSDIFDLDNKNVGKNIIRFKLRRLLYDEIKRLEDMPNFKSSKALGYCLYMMGLKLSENKNASYGREWYALQKAVLNWTQKNYLKLVESQHKVAESCLIGSISFDKDNKQLIKTYIEGLNLEAPKEYLLLDEPSPQGT